MCGLFERRSCRGAVLLVNLAFLTAGFRDVAKPHSRARMAALPSIATRHAANATANTTAIASAIEEDMTPAPKNAATATPKLVSLGVVGICSKRIFACKGKSVDM